MEPVEIEAIARRVAELLRGDPPASDGLIDVGEAARRLGVSRSTIYAKATELGAVRLGHGPKARLRFDAARVRDALVAAPAGTEARGPLRPVARARRRRAPSPGRRCCRSGDAFRNERSCSSGRPRAR